jgi:homocysteine S-methyltransferase
MARSASAESARAEGITIAREMLLAVRDSVQGAQISAPLSRYPAAIEVLQALGSATSARV